MFSSWRPFKFSRHLFFLTLRSCVEKLTFCVVPISDRINEYSVYDDGTNDRTRRYYKGRIVIKGENP